MALYDWYIGQARGNEVFTARDRIVSHYRWPAFVITGKRAKCARSKRCEVEISEYPVLGNYVFFAPLHMNFAWSTMFGATRLRNIIIAEGRPLTIHPDEVNALVARQEAGEWNNWLYDALQYFESRIGTTFTVPCGQHAGKTGIIKQLVGGNVTYMVESERGDLVGSIIDMKKLWPTDYEAKRAASIIQFANGLKLAAEAPDESPQSLNFPFPFGGKDGDVVLRM